MGIEQNNQENLKRLLRETGEEKASLNFTENLLKSLELQVNNQAVTELALKSLLQKHAIEQPSADFQLNIIEQLAPTPTTIFKPIISKKAWYGIAAVVAVLLVACYFYPSATPMEVPRVLRYLNIPFGYAVKFSNIPRSTVEISVMTLIGLSVLLLTDFFLRQKLTSYNKLARS